MTPNQIILIVCFNLKHALVVVYYCDIYCGKNKVENSTWE